MHLAAKRPDVKSGHDKRCKYRRRCSRPSAGIPEVSARPLTYNLGLAMPEFDLTSDFKPTGDQPQAIDQLSRGLESGLKHQTLLGVTGSGKTFTMANVVQQIQRPTLVMAHNKTLAAQLASEFKEFFPNNAVEYFVSYYDYYQPEAYIPRTDTYIEKDTLVNEDIERLRHSAMKRVLTP